MSESHTTVRQRPSPRRSSSSQRTEPESTLEPPSLSAQESQVQQQSRLSSELSALKQDYEGARDLIVTLNWCEWDTERTLTSDSVSKWPAANGMSTILDVWDEASRSLKDLSTIRGMMYSESIVPTQYLASEIEKRISDLKGMIGTLQTENMKRWEALSVAPTDAVGSQGSGSVSTFIRDS
jgi:hypothetical protein